MTAGPQHESRMRVLDAAEFGGPLEQLLKQFKGSVAENTATYG